MQQTAPLRPTPPRARLVSPSGGRRAGLLVGGQQVQAFYLDIALDQVLEPIDESPNMRGRHVLLHHAIHGCVDAEAILSS